MFARMLTFLAVITLVATPAPVRSADESKGAAPSFVIRVDSIDNLLDHAKYLAELAGQKDKAEEGLGFLKVMIESQKIDKSIDFTRPIGAYGKVNSDDFTKSAGVILIPMLDEKPLLDSLKDFNLEPKKGEDGIYAAGEGFSPIPIYFRFSNKYAYISQNKESLAKDAMLDASKVLSPGKAATFFANFRIDQIPDDLKQMAIAKMEEDFAKEKEKEVPGESKAQTEIRRKMLEGAAKHMTRIIKEGAELGLSFNIDRKEGKLTGDLTFSGKPGSQLAKEIADAGKTQSLFGGLVSSKAAINVLLHPILPDDVRQELGAAVGVGFKEEMEKHKNAPESELVEKVFKAIEPSLKSGELDLAFTLRGPSKENHYTFLGAVKLKEGEKVEQALKDLAKKAPPKDQAKIHFDAENSGDVKIHKVDVQGDFDEKARAILGNHPIYIAFRSDAVLVSGGANGLKAIQEGLKGESKEAPAVMFEISMSHLAPLILAHAKGHGDGKPDAEEMKKLVQETFKGDNDKVRITVEGGKAAKASFEMSTAAIKFAAMMGTHSERTFKEVGNEVKPPSKKKAKKEREKEKDKEEDK